MHAWSIVDTANRLRVLAENMRGIKKGAPEHQIFVRRLQLFEDLRNPIQHLNTELTQRASDDGPTYVWGCLAWVLLDEDLKGGSTFMLIPGSVQSGGGPHFVNPAGLPFTSRLDHVELAAYDSRVSLSALVASVAGWTANLEDVLRPQFDGLDRSASDILLSMQLKFDQDGVDPTDPETEPPVGAS